MTIADLKREPHISFSQINTMLMCPLKYKYTYIDGIPMPYLPSSMVLGSAMHKALEHFYQAHLEGVRATKEELADVFGKRWREEEERTEIKYNGDDREATMAMADKLLNVFLEKVQPQNIVAIEQPFRIELEGMPPLVGVLDLIEEDDSGSPVIVDHKCVGKRFSDADLSGNMQMTCYSLAAKHLGYQAEPLLRFDTLLKTKVPAYERQYTIRTDRDRARFLKTVSAVWSAIQKEAFYPNPNFMCGSCQYSAICKDW
jgi:putative RecB family exonuclease